MSPTAFGCEVASGNLSFSTYLAGGSLCPPVVLQGRLGERLIFRIRALVAHTSTFFATLAMWIQKLGQPISSCIVTATRAALPLLICFTASFVAAQSIADGTKGQATSDGRKYCEAFLENFRRIATCELEVEAYRSGYDLTKVSEVYRFCNNGKVTRFDELMRKIGPKGVEFERLTRTCWDGRQTTAVEVDFPGVARDYSLARPNGISASVKPQPSKVITNGMMSAIGFSALCMGAALTFEDALSEAVRIELVDDTIPMVRAVLPDNIRGSRVVKNREIEFHFDRTVGYWPKEVRFRSDKSAGQVMVTSRAVVRVESFQELGGGRFFPSRIVFCTIAEDETRRSGPTFVVTKCLVNTPSTAMAALSLDLPPAVAVLTGGPQVGEIIMNNVLVIGADGDEKRFSRQEEFFAFMKETSDSVNWKSSYSPISGYTYCIDTADKVRSVVPSNQPSAGTGDDDDSTSAMGTTSFRSRWMWGTIIALPIVMLCIWARRHRLRGAARHV